MPWCHKINEIGIPKPIINDKRYGSFFFEIINPIITQIGGRNIFMNVIKSNMSMILFVDNEFECNEIIKNHTTIAKIK